MASSSTTAAPTIPIGPVSLPLVKISYCTTATLRASNMLWKHLPNRDDMFAVFDTIRRRGSGDQVTETRVLKLTCGGDQLETIDLDTLRYQTRLDDQLLESQYLSETELRVVVICRKPLLALRYPLSNGHIRRIQLNFRPESGFDYALDTLRSIGLPVRDRATIDRPHSAQAVLTGTFQGASQERVKDFGRFQRSGSSSMHATSQPQPPLPYSLSHLPASPQHGPRATGIDQDDFSRPISPAMNHVPSESDCYASSSQQLPPPSTPNLLHQNDLITGLRHVRTHMEDSLGFDWQSNPYGSQPIRPTTAPVTRSERQAPDTIPLSLMLPPDRVLPFPGESNGQWQEKSEMSQAPQPLPQSSPSISAPTKVKPIRAKTSKAKISSNNSEKSTSTSVSLGPIRATAPHKLRPGSSPSDTGPSRDPLNNASSKGAVAKVPVQNKVVQKRAELAEHVWALNEARFLKHFNSEVYGSKSFLVELVRFAKIQENFQAAYTLLLVEQKSRRDRLGITYENRQSSREWTSNDVRFATAAHRGSEQGTSSAPTPVRKANTPKKLVRYSSPACEKVTEGTLQPTSNVVQTTAAAPRLSNPSCTPLSPVSSRKRPASALEEPLRSVQIERSSTDTTIEPNAEQQASVEAGELQMEPATTLPVQANIHEQQSIAVGEVQMEPATTLTDHADTNQQQSAASADSSVATIRPIELTSILDAWAKKSGLLLTPPKPLQTPKEALAEFAGQDQGLRIGCLDKLIRECIDDENFVKLAEDIEMAWMRTTPGP